MYKRAVRAFDIAFVVLCLAGLVAMLTYAETWVFLLLIGLILAWLGFLALAKGY